jgi:hypothetical protein
MTSAVGAGIEYCRTEALTALAAFFDAAEGTTAQRLENALGRLLAQQQAPAPQPLLDVPADLQDWPKIRLAMLTGALGLSTSGTRQNLIDRIFKIFEDQRRDGLALAQAGERQEWDVYRPVFDAQGELVFEVRPETMPDWVLAQD